MEFMMMRKFVLMMIAAAGFVSLSAQADVAGAQILADKYAHVAKNINPASKGASAEDGKAFFSRELTLRGKPIACASCHTANPAAAGKHIVTKKEILPLAPSANPKRFSDLDKVEKNFEKHCLDVIKRACTAQEKADFVAYLLTVK
jgi:hypothetical protein